MEGNARTWFTPKQRAELWERWRSGQCVADIARALERRNKSGVYRVLALNGGIAPTPRRRAAVALRLEEREEISRGIAAGRSIRRIAQGLGRSPSTVAREITRNGGGGAYRASEADTRAWDRALRPKSCRLARHTELRWCVAQKLALQWSPEQISGWLKRQFPADQGMQVSYETIYRSLFIQTRGVLKKELMAHLRKARRMRQAKGGTTKSGLGQIVDMVSIRERPAEVEDRTVPGHWEGDYERSRAEATAAAANGWLPRAGTPASLQPPDTVSGPIVLSHAVHQAIDAIVQGEIGKRVGLGISPGIPAFAPSAPASAAEAPAVTGVKLSQALALYLEPRGNKRRHHARLYTPLIRFRD